MSEVYSGYEYLLLDEIQNLEGWDTWVTTLYRRGVNLLITGSNANLLSSEMATLLTGRYVETLMLPFSMQETLEYTHVNMQPQLPAEEAELSNAMEIEQTYLGSLFDSIILKDVASSPLSRPDEAVISGVNRSDSNSAGGHQNSV